MADVRTAERPAPPSGAGRRWRLASQSWWLLPVLIVIALALAQSVPHLDPYRLGERTIHACDSGGLPAPRWPAAQLDLATHCVAIEYRPNLATGAEGALALLLSGVHQDAAVDVNGVRIRDLGGLGYRSNGLAPILLPIGSGLLRTGENRIRLEVRAQPGLNAPVRFRAAHLGPTEVLERWHQRRVLLQEGGARMAVVLMAAMLLVLMPIAAAGPPNPVLRWYAVAIVGAGLYLLSFVSTWRPLPSLWYELLGFSALGLSLAAFTRLSDLELDRPPRRAPFVIAVLAGLMVAGSAFLPGMSFLPMNVAGRLLLLGIVADLGLRWWRGRHLPKTPDPRWFLGGVALLLLLGLSDSFTKLLGPQWPAIAYLLHWGILYVLSLMFAALIVRLLRALRAAEGAQQRLSVALAERTRELTAEFALRREAETARMLSEERQRILRDMHDGVGGQLVALMTRAQAGKLAPAALSSALHRTLNDLRLMVDSLDPACADLSVALAMLRRRSAGLAPPGGAELVWRTALLPDLPPLPPATVLHVLRIVQEALSNALQHAGARRITVEASWDGAAASIAVVDDGRGGVRDGAGRGTVHMRQRAAAIGASLEIASGAVGTRVALRLPFPDDAARTSVRG